MKSHIAWCLWIVVAASYPVSADGADQPAKRVKRTCAQMREDLERIGKDMKMPLKMTAGSWGDLPEPLRKLPPATELCGAGSMGQVVFVSPASAKDLESHYAPLFAEVGCKPLECQPQGPTINCSCHGTVGTVGMLSPQHDAETYSIVYKTPAAPKSAAPKPAAPKPKKAK